MDNLRDGVISRAHLVRRAKYLLAFTIPLAGGLSLLAEGVWTFGALVYAFGLLPLLELVLPPARANLSDVERSYVARDPWFDRLLVLMVPIQVGLLAYFVTHPGEDGVTFTGRVFAMGLLCGVLGINVAHELGHRPDRFSQRCAHVLLATSLYTHFFIEHNRGHHRNVATPDDPATARRGEWVQLFWLRAVFGGIAGAWRLEAERLRRQGKSPWHLDNQFLRLQALQWAAFGAVAWGLGSTAALGWLAAAAFGGCLLETVNYIEHYGLQRPRLNAHRYVPVEPEHSWNSDHVLGRMILFELSRHSDHHHRPAQPYAQLDHIDHAPQLPTGYPGMMLLSLVPPLFFRVMRPRLAAVPSGR
jgi:alkane 1-monooxygenase